MRNLALTAPGRGAGGVEKTWYCGLVEGLVLNKRHMCCGVAEQGDSQETWLGVTRDCQCSGQCYYLSPVGHGQ